MSIGLFVLSLVAALILYSYNANAGNCDDETSLLLFYDNDDVNAETKCAVARDCKAWFDAGITKSGIYPIKPNGGDAFQVYCDMETDGGGWTVFLRRQDGSVSFDRNWKDYVTGFGNLSNEFWLGLSKLHRLTPDGTSALRVDLGDFKSNMVYAEYSEFEILDATADYALVVKNYNGSAGNALGPYSLMRFTTKDNDNDIHHKINCAAHHGGGWWFGACYSAHLTGPYVPGGKTKTRWVGIIWHPWKGPSYSLRFAEMKLRRN